MARTSPLAQPQPSPKSFGDRDVVPFPFLTWHGIPLPSRLRIELPATGLRRPEGGAGVEGRSSGKNLARPGGLCAVGSPDGVWAGRSDLGRRHGAGACGGFKSRRCAGRASRDAPPRPAVSRLSPADRASGDPPYPPWRGKLARRGSRHGRHASGHDRTSAVERRQRRRATAVHGRCFDEGGRRAQCDPARPGPSGGRRRRRAHTLYSRPASQSGRLGPRERSVDERRPASGCASPSRGYARQACGCGDGADQAARGAADAEDALS